jgi:hypothetical protein
MPLMKVKKHKFNRGFIEWEVMQQMLQAQTQREAAESRKAKPKPRQAILPHEHILKIVDESEVPQPENNNPSPLK